MTAPNTLAVDWTDVVLGTTAIDASHRDANDNDFRGFINQLTVSSGALYSSSNPPSSTGMPSDVNALYFNGNNDYDVVNLTPVSPVSLTFKANISDESINIETEALLASNNGVLGLAQSITVIDTGDVNFRVSDANNLVVKLTGVVLSTVTLADTGSTGVTGFGAA